MLLHLVVSYISIGSVDSSMHAWMHGSMDPWIHEWARLGARKGPGRRVGETGRTQGPRKAGGP